jgi:hypothetical protein
VADRTPDDWIEDVFMMFGCLVLIVLIFVAAIGGLIATAWKVWHG